MPGESDSSVEATGVRRRWLRTFDSLALPPYRRYFIAMLFYFGAMQATVLVRPILAFELADRAPIVLGIAIAANNAPSLLLSPFAGALADKVSMRNILMVAAVLMALFAGITAVGVALDVVDWWHVTIIGVFQGSVMVFITPTRRAIIGGLVDEAHLLNATGLHTMSQNANRVFLPLLAGFLFARYGAEWAYVLIVGMYLVAIVLMFAVPVRGAGASRSRRRSGSPLEGFRYVKQEPAIRNLLLVGLVITVFGQPFQHLLPLAQEFLMIEADGIGLLFTFFGVGSLLGSTTSGFAGGLPAQGVAARGVLHAVRLGRRGVRGVELVCAVAAAHAAGGHRTLGADGGAPGDAPGVLGRGDARAGAGAERDDGRADTRCGARHHGAGGAVRGARRAGIGGKRHRGVRDMGDVVLQDAPQPAVGRRRDRAARRSLSVRQSMPVSSMGSSNMNRLPAPGVLSAHRRPPCASTSCFAIDRPRPTPPVALARDGSAR